MPDPTLDPPVTIPCAFTVTVLYVPADTPLVGRSAFTILLNEGVPDEPLGEAKTRFPDCEFNVKLSAGVDVAFKTLVVNSPDRLPELKEVTLPLPEPEAPK